MIWLAAPLAASSETTLGHDVVHGDGGDGEVDLAGFDVGGVHEVFDEVDHALVGLW
jgi:hypothetical protein